MEKKILQVTAEGSHTGPTLDDVRDGMQRPLPGPAAQISMAPRPRALRPPEGSRPRQAGVLLLLYPLRDVLHIPLTVRTPELNHHSGQISLPGGGHEPQDRSFRETALRETQEELGIDPTTVEVLGPLTSLYIPPSNNVVHPFVAYTPLRPDFDPDPREVARMLEVPLPLFLAPETRREEEWERNGSPYHVPYYAIDAYQVWGATAIILAEFLALLENKGGGV